MTFDALTNRGEYLTPYFIEEVLPDEIRKNISARWTEREKPALALKAPASDRARTRPVRPRAESHGRPLAVSVSVSAPVSDSDSGLRTASVDAEPADFRAAVTPRAGLRDLRRYYYERKSDLLVLDPDEDDVKRAEVLRQLHDGVLAALSFPPHRYTRTVIHSGSEVAVPLAADVSGVWAVECDWALNADEAVDPVGAGRLLDPVVLSPRETVTYGMRLASHLFTVEEPPRYVLLLAGGVMILADRRTWGEGRYLAANLDAAFSRHDTKPGGEMDVIAALFGADALCPPESGGAEPLADLIAGSQKQAVGVTAELRNGLRESVELIAGEVLARLAEAGVRPEQIDDLKTLGDRLTREALRYLYRILVLLYAEARPELGMLPVDHPEYAEGYSLARLGDLVARRPPNSPAARNGTHLFESLDRLFTAVNQGYHARGTTPAADTNEPGEPGEPAPGAGADERHSEREGIRFEALRSDLFEPSSITLIGQSLPWPDDEDDEEDQPARAGRPEKIDTRLRNGVLYAVLRHLMITKGGRRARGGARRRGGFISYRQLGIPQLGAVYEGLMSYTGFIAGEALYEVAKGGDPKDGSWTVPTSRADQYAAEVFVHEVDADGHRTDRRQIYPAGSFVYRLSGRDRQTSASYYTPQSLTEVTVQLALQYRVEEAGPDFKAREMLDWTICEPALGSGAFLNEAINQVAAKYLHLRQEEKRADGTLDEPLDPERYAVELQKVKAYIALHNSYGVDLNATAIELADVSLWLNVMHPGLQAPWFGLHLRRGNSLVGAGRRYYTQDTLADRSWLTSAPVDHPFRDGALPKGAIHHFLLPAAGWGAVAAEKEAKDLAPVDAKKLGAWRRAMTKAPRTKAAKGKTNQAAKLAALTRRAEYLWTLVQQRLALSEAEIRRQIDVWGAEDLPEVREVVPRAKILADLEAPGTPYWRLKKLMDTWCALWFWPVDAASLLDGSAPDYQRASLRVTTATSATPAAPTAPTAAQSASGTAPAPTSPSEPTPPRTWETASIFDDDGTLANTALIAPQTRTAASPSGKKQNSLPPPPLERIRGPFPLANLDDWIRFATALIGTEDVGQDTFAAHFSTLDELETHEEDLASWLGQEEWHRLAELFPWLDTVETIATRQSFFHWDVEFAQVFTNRGGFDLQVGNPPWVRPDWTEDLVLAEREPWFALTPESDIESQKKRRKSHLAEFDARNAFLLERADNVGIAGQLGSSAQFKLLEGTRPNLYRAFMIQVWRHQGTHGTSGLIHPDTHFSGKQEKNLRAASYRHLRLHAHIHNRRLLFSDIDWSRQFSINIYGTEKKIEFLHLSWLFDPTVLISSLAHDGTGVTPTIKHDGYWDLRPHRSRVIQVNTDTLSLWQRLAGEPGGDPASASLLYPVSSAEQGAIEALANWQYRVKDQDPYTSVGILETKARRDGLIGPSAETPHNWEDVIIRGPQISISTPFAKMAPNTKHTDKPVQLLSLPADAVPATDYVRVSSVDLFRSALDKWGGRPCTDMYRLFWRELIPQDTERSLFPAIEPPGPTHVNAVHSLAASNNRDTAITAGFWSSIPLDYLLRTAGRSHLNIADARAMPTGSSNHPLASALILRVLRLNCLTKAYAPLWNELFEVEWETLDSWATAWPTLERLANVEPEWTWNTPLRAELARRAALVEIDALVSTWLGIDIDALIAIYRSRFPQLVDYETQMWFDAKGRKIAANFNAYGHGQTKEDWIEFQEHLKNPKMRLPPAGYAAPFYKADREKEMRAAHAVFSARLQAARDAGWRESEDGPAGVAAELGDGVGTGRGAVVEPGSAG
ncbi:site-specific DNA-methyltransferase (adenine-specific) [Frankia sp. AiPs1]|uniref:hypothetical protein n=1 Tax=Frankia sp. AiPa1 TaxID=573492 RepID=UPI00202B5D42|nr:hypothetical protein [Frankia sp. AiPa1]MCL9762160.1 hypothetical protein [Frankia sp. AiPa1]